MTRERVVLALNSGSSSRKAALFAVGPAGARALAAGAAERLDTPGAHLWIESGGQRVSRALSGDAARASGALDQARLGVPGFPGLAREAALGLPCATANPNANHAASPARRSRHTGTSSASGVRSARRAEACANEPR